MQRIKNEFFWLSTEFTLHDILGNSLFNFLSHATWNFNIKKNITMHEFHLVCINSYIETSILYENTKVKRRLMTYVWETASGLCAERICLYYLSSYDNSTFYFDIRSLTERSCCTNRNHCIDRLVGSYFINCNHYHLHKGNAHGSARFSGRGKTQHEEEATIERSSSQ